jgi:LPS sulfotransferase NodH
MPDGIAAAPPRPSGAPAWDPAAGGSSLGHVAVACTLRSGSNLLCDMLRANGFGAPKEWFQDKANFDAGLGHAGSGHLLLERQMQAFEAAHDASPWRGVKFDWLQFQRLRDLAPGLPAAAAMLEDVARGRWLFLRRRDVAAQAVSLYAAQVTGAWMGESEAEYDRVPQDFDAIHARFAALCAGSFAWENFFRTHGGAPICLYYEDLVAGGAPAWLAVLRHLDPGFDAARLDLTPLQAPPRSDGQLRPLKTWFRDELIGGRQPRSHLVLLEEIASMVAQAVRAPTVEGVLGRFAADRLACPAGFTLRKLDLDRDLRREGPGGLVAQDHFLNGVALRLDPGGACAFSAPAGRVMLEFHAHAWSGIAEIRIGDAVVALDLFSERAATRHFIRELLPGFAGPIEIRSSGERNLLSAGGEVWLQRAFVLADSGD